MLRVPDWQPGVRAAFKRRGDCRVCVGVCGLYGRLPGSMPIAVLPAKAMPGQAARRGKLVRFPDNLICYIILYLTDCTAE